MIKADVVIILDFLEFGGATAMMTDLTKKYVSKNIIIFAGHYPGNNFNLDSTFPKNVELITFPVNFSKPMLFVYLEIIINSFAKSFILQKKVNAQTLLVFNQSSSLVGLLINIKLRFLRKVFIFHGDWPEEFLSKFRFQKYTFFDKITKKIFDFIEKIAIATSYEVIAFSKYSKRILLKKYKKNHSNITLASPSLFSFPKKDSIEAKAEAKTTFLYCSRIEPRKGLDYLIKAILNIDKKTLNSIEVIICGEIMSNNLFLDAFHQLANKTIPPVIKFIPYQKRENLYKLYDQVDCILMPSIAHETMGMVTLEALSRGIPVIGFNNGATPEILSLFETLSGKNLLVKKSSSKNLAYSMIFFSRLTKKQRKRISKEAINVYYKFIESKPSLTQIIHQKFDLQPDKQL